MKKYNRTTKKWEPTGEEKVKVKKRDTCRGGKEHSFLLTLPHYLPDRVSMEASITPQAIVEYYASKERLCAFLEKENAILASYGLTNRFMEWFRNDKDFICEVCGKRKTEWGKDSVWGKR